MNNTCYGPFAENSNVDEVCMIVMQRFVGKIVILPQQNPHTDASDHLVRELWKYKGHLQIRIVLLTSII